MFYMLIFSHYKRCVYIVEEVMIKIYIDDKRNNERHTEIAICDNGIYKIANMMSF